MAREVAGRCQAWQWFGCTSPAHWAALAPTRFALHALAELLCPQVAVMRRASTERDAARLAWLAPAAAAAYVYPGRRLAATFSPIAVASSAVGFSSSLDAATAAAAAAFSTSTDPNHGNPNPSSSPQPLS